jgi:hypothetical protein
VKTRVCLRRVSSTATRAAIPALQIARPAGNEDAQLHGQDQTNENSSSS